MNQKLLFTPAAIWGSLAAMLAIGALTAAYGPSLPGLIAAFDLETSDAGAGLGVQSFGAVLGVLAAPKIMRARGNRTAMVLNLALIIVGVIAVAMAPNWPTVLVSAAIVGLGLGGIDLLVTQLLIFGAGQRGPFLVNVAHASFGLGTVVAPGLLSVLGADAYSILFLTIGAVAVIGLMTMSGLAQRPTPADRPEGHQVPAKHRPTLIATMIIGGFVVLYIAHFGVQAAIGNWEPTYLADIGHTASTAALATSGFWLAMVVGRFVAAFLTNILAIPRIVLFSCIGMVLSLVFTVNDDLVMWVLFACGFFIGPIFPNGLTWLAQSGHGHGERFAYVMAASMVGMAVTPWALGVAIEQIGLSVVPPALTGIAAVALLAATLLYHRVKKAVPA